MSPATMFANFDGDGDGKISSEEMSGVPDFLKERLASADENGDGAIDLAELTSAMAKLRAERGGGPPGDSPGGPVGAGE